MKKDLERKINGFKLGLASAAIALMSAACPSAVVPVKFYTATGIKESGVSCCAELNCSSHGYDSCEVDGTEIKNGAVYESCHCYDKYVPSSRQVGTGGGWGMDRPSPEDFSDYDRSRAKPDRDRGSGGARTDRY